MVAARTGQLCCRHILIGEAPPQNCGDDFCIQSGAKRAQSQYGQDDFSVIPVRLKQALLFVDLAIVFSSTNCEMYR